MIHTNTRKWFRFSFALMILAAICSYTFHHFDEQFQILEFAGLKLGKTPESAMRWEYPTAMRAWLQPGIYVAIARFWTMLGIENPFFWAVGYRLLSGVLTWLGLTWLILENWDYLDERMQHWVVRLQTLLWFVPYLSVRTSGETFTTAFLLLGLAATSRYARVLKMDRHVDSYPRLAFGIGGFLSLAALTRFPSAVFVLGVLAWLLWQVRPRVRDTVALATGGLIPVAFCALVDKWGYGYWTFPMWNYLYQNLVLGKSHEFGTAPFFAYLYLPLANFMAGPALVLLVGTLLFWRRWPRHLLTWTTLPYVLVHSLLAHKEARFLFPVAMLTPLMVPMAAQQIAQTGGKWAERAAGALRALPSKWIFKVLLAWNLIALAYLTTCTTRKEMSVQRQLFSADPEHAVVLHWGTPHPYQSTGMPSYFYRSRQADILQIRDGAHLAQALGQWCLDKPSNWVHVFTRGGPSRPSALAVDSCDVAYESLPEFKVIPDTWRLEKNSVWLVRRCGIQICAFVPPPPPAL